MRVQVSYGAGAYICGEETALLESLEGKQVGSPGPLDTILAPLYSQSSNSNSSSRPQHNNLSPSIHLPAVL
jgi:hypothetical protein